MKRQPKYKFILHWFFSPRDRSGNVYSYGCIVDTKSGRCLRVADVPESNLRGVAFDLNGGEHKQNYWWAATEVPQRELFRRMNDIPHVSDIPAAFRKLMKSRKKGAGLPA
jgi:hypothetical protein